MFSSPLYMFALAALTPIVLSEMGKWDDEFDYSTYLEENHQFRLYWTNLGSDLIEFGIEAVSTGYVALGLSPNGGMQNSDIMLGWVDSDGVAHLEDRFTDDTFSAPQLDAHQDLELIEGEEEGNITRIRFTRSLSNACDTDEDMAVTIGTSRIIYAWNDADPSDGEIIYHGAGNRGSQSVNLNGGQERVVELEDDVDSFELRMDEWPVASDDDTEYVCKFLALPEFEEKQHIVMVEPLITAGNEGTAHHMILYMCPESALDANVTFGGQEVCDEWDTNMPSPDCRANRLQYSWGIGGGTTYFPAEAGMPFGGDHEFKYAFLEIHYDNPELRDDIVDSSGLRLYYTPSLREHDIGVITYALLLSRLLVPPGIDTVLTGSCSSSCTSQHLPEEGVTLFGNLLHSHTAGVSMAMRHIRNGEELAPIEVNENYDFNFQAWTILEETRTLLPGDEFIVHCGYDTTARDGITYGGESSAQEMCIDFMMVYPAPELTFCADMQTVASRSAWAQDMFDAGYFMIDETTLSELIDDADSQVTQFGDIDQGYYEALGVTWNDLGNTSAMFNKIFEDEKYAARSLYCETAPTFTLSDHELAAFTEYEAEEAVCEEDVVEDAAAVTVPISCFLMLSVLFL